MHVFLTGALQSGKSTAIDRVLAAQGLTPGGFRTRWNRPAGRLELRLLDGRAPHTLVAARMTPQGVRADAAAFDQAGRRLLECPAGALLVMDELGFLERCSPCFQRAVLALLDGPRPVLGVLRTHPDSVFVPSLSRRGDVRLLPLTAENRDQIPGLLPGLLGLA